MASLLQERPAGRFLRYRFDNAAQLRRHCRLVDGRVLLFFPAPLAERSRALIELCLANSGQQVSLPALVRSRVFRGAWLEMRALSVVAGLQSAVATPRRNERRLALDQLAWVDHDDGPVLACPVLDLSRSGVRLWGVPGGAPVAGDRIRVRLTGAPTMAGQIRWAHGREVGVRFAPESLARAAGLYAHLEMLWAAARLAVHDASCACLSGGDPLDPPSPAARHEGLR